MVDPIIPTKSEIDSDSKSNLSTSSHNSPFTVEKLNGRNFKEQAQSLKLIIDVKGKLGYLTGEITKPVATNFDAPQRWSSKNSMVTAWLV